MTLTGQQIDTVLEQQFGNPAAGQNRILSPSASLTYAYSLLGVLSGARSTSRRSSIDGTPISAATSYRVTVNSFLATGGDNFLELANGTDRLGGAVDLDAVEQYFDAQSGPVAPPAQNRITAVP